LPNLANKISCTVVYNSNWLLVCEGIFPVVVFQIQW
jgi:hypothetical protein